jgi:hypothetical protein
MAGGPDAVDEAGLEAIAIASTVVGFDDATQHAISHSGGNSS